MPEVLEIEQIAETGAATQPQWDSWVVRIPPEIIAAQNLAEDAKVVLSCKNGEINATILPPTPGLKDFVQRITGEQKDFFEEMKRIGD